MDPRLHELRLEAADTFNDPVWGPIEVKTYGGTLRRLRSSLAQATLQSDNSVYIQLALDLGPDEVKQTALRHGHQDARSTATRPRRSAA